MLPCSTRSNPEGLFKCCNVNAALARPQLALHVARVCAFCYSNNGLVIKQHATFSFTTCHVRVGHFRSFSCSNISQFCLLNLYFSSLDYCCITPDCLRALFPLLTFQSQRNTEPYTLLPSASLYLPHSLLRRALEVVLVRSRSNSVSKKKPNWKPSACLHLILGVSSVHSRRTGLSFSFTDRDNPLSSTTSGFLLESLAQFPTFKYHLSLHCLYAFTHRRDASAKMLIGSPECGVEIT